MSVFADSSALVKLYADEPGSELMHAIPMLVVSQLARVEVPAALWHKQRLGTLSPDEAAVLVSAFEADYYGAQGYRSRLAPVDVNIVVLEAAARVARRHGLRSLDASQLASAVLAREAEPTIAEFAVWDKRLRDAAHAEGFTLLPS